MVNRSNVTNQKGIVRKLTFIPRTLDEGIVRDGLESVSLLNRTEPYYLVGGIATQSYLPTTCRRATSDIDFAVVRSLNYQEFKNMVRPLGEWFEDNRYFFETKKRSRAYSLDVTNPEGETLCLEFSRRNKKSLEGNGVRLSREFEHSKMKTLEERGTSYRVASPEDIVIPKLVRSLGSLERNPLLRRYISQIGGVLTSEKISAQLRRISEVREDAMANIADPELAERLRFISDLYDVRVLSELSGFNQSYLREVSHDCEYCKLDKFRTLAKTVLPDFVSN
ncbi:MAG: hypothetical protein KKB79_02515 [Nanoarchaeota archaeon]|nr:hypothetical protein [Nanoarchaeota archaeon]